MSKQTPLGREPADSTLRTSSSRVLFAVLRGLAVRQPGSRLTGVIFYTCTRARGILAVSLVLALTAAGAYQVMQPGVATAAAANTINFQARLETAAGAIAADGNYNVRFKLYSASSGGSALWTETYQVANTTYIRTANGYLTANLGSITAFPSNINWGQQIYLTMEVGGTGSSPTWDGEMSPRLALTSVPSAFALNSYNSANGFTGSLTVAQPTGGNQLFSVPDQGAAGSYTLLTTTAANTSYIQNQNASPQAANFNINGTATANAFILSGNGGASSRPAIEGPQGQRIYATSGGGWAFGNSGGATKLSVSNGTSDVNLAGLVDIGRANVSLFVGPSSSRYVRYDSGANTELGFIDNNLGQSYALQSASTIGLQLKANASQTADLVQFQNSSSAKMSGFNAAGQFFNQNGIYMGTIAQGTLTANRTYTLPDVSGTVCLTSTCGGTIGGSGTANYVARFTNATDLGTGVLYDNGTFVGVGTASQISGGTLNILAGSGQTALTVRGNSTNNLLTARNAADNATVFSVDANGKVTASGGGTFSGSTTGNGSSVIVGATNANVSSSPNMVNGVSAGVTGTANTSGGTMNTNNSINLQNATAVTGNTFNGIYAGTGYNSLLNYNGTSLISGTGLLQNSIFDSSLNYSNLQKVTNLNATGNLTVDGSATFNTQLYANDIRPVSGGVVYVNGGGLNVVSGVLTANAGLYVLAGTFDVRVPITSNTGSNSFAGDLGIGTSTPGQRLDVQGGNINTSGNLMTGGATRISSTGAGTLTTLSLSGVLTSTVATGTAPLTVASITKVANLNADLLDGLDSTAFAPASGSANYIQNSSSVQTANFFIQSATAGTVGATIQGAASQTANLLNFLDSGGSTSASFSSTGGLQLFNGNARLLVGATASTARVSVTANGTTQVSQSITAVASQTADLFQLQNSSGTALGGFNASGQHYNQSGIYTGTLIQGGLSANRTYTLPDASGALCLDSAVNNCSYLTTTNAATGYIQNQSSAAQNSSAFYISGNGRTSSSLIADTSVVTPLVDTASGVALNIGTTNATAINLNKNVVVASNQSLRLVGGATANRPASPAEGTIFFDTDTKQLLTYANGKWQADRSDTVIVAASNSSQNDKDAADYVADGNTATAADGDQVQINQALTAGAGKKIVLLAGTYTLDAAISIPNNTTLSGVGTGTIITIPNSLNTNFSAIINTDQTTGTKVTVQDLLLDGNSANQSGANIGMAGIDFSGMGSGAGATTIQGARILNVHANNWYSNGTVSNCQAGVGICIRSSLYTVISGSAAMNNANGIRLSASLGNIITENNLQGNTYGIRALSASNYNVISDNLASGNAYGMAIVTSVGNTINDNQIVANTTNGILLDTNANSNVLSANKLSDNGGNTANNAIYIFSSDSNTITSNYVTDASATTTNFAINVNNSTSDTNYLSDNALGGGSINDAGTGTVYGGQVNSTGNYLIQPASTASIELMRNTNVTGTLAVTGLASLNGGATVRGALTVNTATATDDQIILNVATGGAARFDGTITNADLTAARTWTLPNETGTICTTATTGVCATAGSGFVQFAPAAVQADGTNNNSIFINKTSGTGNILQLQKSGADVLNLSNAGDLTLTGTQLIAKTSATAFQVRDGSSNNYFTIDTSTPRVTIGTVGGCASPQGRLCINTSTGTGGNTGTLSNTTYTVNGTASGSTNNASQINLIDTSGNANTLQGLIVDSTASTSATSTINGIIGKVSGSQPGNFIQGLAGGISQFSVTNAGLLTTAGNAAINGGTLTVGTATATDDRVRIQVTAGGASRFTGIITNADLTADRTYTLPDTSGTICLTTTCSGTIGGSGTTSYVARFTNSSTLGTGLLYDTGTYAGANVTSQLGTSTFGIQGAASQVALIVQGAASQNITEFRSSGGTPYFTISSTGVLTASQLASGIVVSTSGVLSSVSSIPIANGGTGLTTAPTANGQLLIGSAGGSYALNTIGAGGASNIVVTNGANTISLATSMSPTFTTSVTTPILQSATATALLVDSGTTGDLNIGTAANAKTITIGNNTGATAVNVNVGSGNFNVTGTSNLTGASNLVGTASINATGSAVTSIGTANGAVNIGGNSSTLDIKSTNFKVATTGVVNFVAGSADNTSYLCRNTTGQIATCNTTGSSGVAFVQGGNNFGANDAVLGTTNTQALLLKTNNLTRLTISSGGVAAYTGDFGITGNLTVTGDTAITGAGAFTLAAGKALTVSASAAPTGNLAVISNASGTTATANGISGQQITWFGAPTGTNTNSGQTISVTNTNVGAGGQIQGLRIIAAGAGGSVNSDTVGIRIDNFTSASSGTGTENAIEIGTGWDNILQTATLNITAAGVASGLTGLSSSGTINFSGLTTDGLVTVTGGTLGSTTSIGVANGGTGLTAAPTNGQIPIGNGTGYTLNTLALAATNPNLVITNGAGTIALGTVTNPNFTSSVTTPQLQSGASAALTITGNAASTWSTSAGNLTLQAGSGTVSFGTSTMLVADGSLTIRPAAGLTVQSTGGSTLLLDSTGGGDVQLGTGSNGKTITLGNVTGSTEVRLLAGLGGFNVTAASLFTGASTFVGATNVNSSGAAATLIGNTSSSVTLGSTIVGLSAANPIIRSTIANGGLSVQSNGTGTLALDSSASGGTVTVGTTNATTVTVGNTSGTTTTSLRSGQGGITITATGNSAANGTLVVSATGNSSITTTTGSLTIGSGSGTLGITSGTTTLQRTASTDFNFDLNDASNRSLILRNSGTGAASLNLFDGGITTGSSQVVRLDNSGNVFGANGTFTAAADATNIFQVQNAAKANMISVDTNAANLAINGGAENGATFATNWQAYGTGATVSRTTTSGEYLSGAAAVSLTITEGLEGGAQTNLGAALANGTYLVSFSVKSSGFSYSDSSVYYLANGTTQSNLANCGTISMDPGAWKKINCTLTVNTAGTSAAAIALIGDQGKVVYIDNFSITSQTSFALNVNQVRIGGATGQGLTLLTVDSSAAAPTTNGVSNDALIGSLYYDTNNGALQCYGASGWGACGVSPNVGVNLIPEYSGAVLNGKQWGANNVGTLTSDFCSYTLAINKTTDDQTCGTSGDEYNYYKWTSPQATGQTYSIYVKYQMPATFKTFADNNTVTLSGRSTSVANNGGSGVNGVRYGMYYYNTNTNALVQCGSTTTVTASAGAWSSTSLGGSGEQTCTANSGVSGGIGANSIVLFRIDVTASNSSNAYVSNLSFLTIGK